MNAHNSCPRCLLEIAQERWQMQPVICNSCGCVVTDSEHAVEDKIEKTFLRTVIGFSIVAILGFVQVATWGNDFIEASWLQIGEITRINSRASSERMATICYNLQKWDCVERIYGQLATSRNPEDALRYSKLLMSRAKYKPATEAFKRYFAVGGKDVEASYLFGRALAENGQIDEASRYFDSVLKAKPGILQVTVVQNYVKYLVRANRLDQARRVIERVRSQGETVSQFMDLEFKEISARLASNRS